MKPFTLDLPRPPSINRLWRHGRGKHYNSPAYLQWITDADMVAIARKYMQGHEMVIGKWIADITIKRVARFDLDNLGTKALFDWLESREFVRSDHDNEGYTVRWGDAPEGCRVTITPLQKADKWDVMWSKPFNHPEMT